jgi:glycosyltransferase involved in cell wall biosynthesis
MARESISVVVPLYNKGPHIGRSINSILAQTSSLDEIIVINDASTDDGVAQVSVVNDPRIRMLHRDEPGPGGYAARNKGIEAATSEWIAFLDADDTWMPGAMAEVRRLIAVADDGVSCIFTGYNRDYGERIETAKGIPGLRPGETKRLTLSGYLDAWLLSGQSPMWTSAVVARRRSLIEAGLFPAGKCNRGGDKDMWLRLLTVGDAVCSSATTATYYQNSVNMVTRTTNTNQRPFLCSTLEGLLPASPPDIAHRIERLINWEMYCHARDAWRTRKRIGAELYKGFIVRQNPATYVLLTCMARAPEYILNASYRARDRIKRRKLRVNHQPAL